MDMNVSPSLLNPMFIDHIDGDYEELVHDHSKKALQQDIMISSTSIYCDGIHDGYVHKVSHNAYENYMVKHRSGHHDQPSVWHNWHHDYLRGSG